MTRIIGPLVYASAWLLASAGTVSSHHHTVPHRGREVEMKNGNAKFAVGFLVGAGVGIIGALLMAPMSGKRLRRGVVRESHRLAHRISETAGELRDKGADVREAATGAARDLRKAARALSG